MNKTSRRNKILVIEDEADILFSLKTFLESEGYEVSTAENGEQGMEYLRTHPMPNLILLDMKMPVMSGWDFSRNFYKVFDHKAPIVVMTAAADAEERAKEARADGWLGKPFSLDEISAQIKKLTERSSALA